MGGNGIINHHLSRLFPLQIVEIGDPRECDRLEHAFGLQAL
jgi:hypothetical protein